MHGRALSLQGRCCRGQGPCDSKAKETEGSSLVQPQAGQQSLAGACLPAGRAAEAARKMRRQVYAPHAWPAGHATPSACVQRAEAGRSDGGLVHPWLCQQSPARPCQAAGMHAAAEVFKPACCHDELGLAGFGPAEMLCTLFAAQMQTFTLAIVACACKVDNWLLAENSSQDAKSSVLIPDLIARSILM